MALGGFGVQGVEGLGFGVWGLGFGYSLRHSNKAKPTTKWYQQNIQVYQYSN